MELKFGFGPIKNFGGIMYNRRWKMIYKKILRFLIESQKSMKHFSKVFLKVIISVELCLAPVYSYSAQDNGGDLPDSKSQQSQNSSNEETQKPTQEEFTQVVIEEREIRTQAEYQRARQTDEALKRFPYHPKRTYEDFKWPGKKALQTSTAQSEGTLKPAEKPESSVEQPATRSSEQVSSSDRPGRIIAAENPLFNGGKIVRPTPPARSFEQVLSATEPASPIQALLEKLKKNIDIDNPEVLRTQQEIIDLATAIEQGTETEYLKQNPQVKEKRDHFLLADQKAEIIEYHVDEEKGEVVEKVEHVVNLNNYTSRSVYTVFKNVHVKYNNESKMLTFEGITGDTVQLRQHVPNMDIIDYVNDGEVLSILDKKRGLILVDMFFARSYLGLAPVPFVQVIPVDKMNPELFSGSQKVSIEFINRVVRPPDVVPEYIDNIAENFKSDRLFTAGDLMISYQDQNGKKVMAQFLKRTEIVGWVKLNYEVLDIMTKVVAPHLMQAEDLNTFEKEINDIKEKDPNTMLDRIMSALFTKQALQKFQQAADGVKLRMEQLDNLPERDIMSFNEWQESFQRVSSELMEKDSSQEGPLSTEQIAKYYQAKEEQAKRAMEKQKDIRATALKIMANIVSSAKTGKDFVAKHQVSSAVVGTGALVGFVFPEAYISLVNVIFPMFHNLIYSGSFSSYKMTTLPHLLAMVALFPGLIIALSAVSIPFAKGMQKILPKDVSLAGQVYHPKGWTGDFINKWGNTTVSQKIVGLGMKFVAYTIYPVWNYFAYWVGQPHFFSAIQKGLNPLKKVTPQSDIGEIAKLTKPVRFGINSPHWRHNGAFNRQSQLQNAAQAKNERIQSIAWLMASLAVAGKEGVSPEQIIIYGTSSVNLKDLETVHNDMKLKMEMLWVMRHLKKEIQALGEMDIRKELSELEPRMIIDYYEKAKELAKEARAHSDFRKKSREFFNTGFVNTVRHRLSAPSVFGANKPQHEMLKNVPTDFVTNRVSTEFLTDHLLVTLLPLITTDRSNFNMNYLEQLAVNDGIFSWSSKPHLNDIWLNVIIHFFIAGGQLTMTYTEKTNTIQKAQTEHRPFYEPIERHTDAIRPRAQSEVAYFGRQFSYLGSGGKQDNLGDVMWRMYVSRLRSIQMTMSLAVGLRFLLGGQPPMDAVFGFLLFHLAGQWMFAWPWDIIQGGARVNGRTLSENQKRMDELKLKLSRVARGTQKDIVEIRKEYESALNEVLKLYDKKGLRKYILESGIRDSNRLLFNFLHRGYDVHWGQKGNITRMVDVHGHPANSSWTEGVEKWHIPENVEMMRATSSALMKVLAEHPPLPNRHNQVGNFVMTGLFGALLTSYLAIFLMVMTFSGEYLNLKTIGMWAGINYSLYLLFYLAYKKGLKDHLKDIKNWREPLNRQKESLKEWKEVFQALKAPEESWNHYFYGRFLDLSRSVSARCERAWSGIKSK